MAVFIGVLVVVGWLVTIFALFVKGLDASERVSDFLPGASYRPAVAYFIACAVVLAGGIAIIAAMDSSGEDSLPLCVRGHQEWQTTTTPVLAGKVVVPMSTREKVWICDAREAN